MDLIVKFGLLILSMLGYFTWCKAKWKIGMELLPALFCAAVSNILMLAGILNILQETAYTVFAVGFLLLALALVKEKYRPTVRDLVFLGVFLAILGYFCLFFRGQELTGYDDFSHWALAAKNMLYSDAMPVEGDLVSFQAYPMGSTLFIYYCSNILGSTDACMLWSQTMLLVSMVMSLFALVDRKNIECALAAVAVGLYALVMNIPINALLIDTMLSVAGIAGFVCLLSLRERPVAAMACVGVFGMFLTNVKNSGLFFAAALVILLVWMDPRAVLSYIRGFAGLCLVPPFMTWLLWNRHVALVFSTGLWSKHAMSAEMYSEMAAKKTPEIIEKIVTDVLREFLSFGDISVMLWLLGVAAFAVVGVLSVMANRKQNVKRLVSLAVVLALIVVAYQIGIIAMYIFSMPIDEAIVLASYDRYERSVALFVFGAAFAYAVYAYGGLRMNVKQRGVAACLLTLLFAAPTVERKGSLRTLYTRIDFENSDRARLRRIADEAGLARGEETLFYTMEYDYGFLFHLSTYELWTSGNEVWHVMETFLEKLPAYRQAMCWEYDENVKAVIEQTGYPYQEVGGALIIWPNS